MVLTETRMTGHCVSNIDW